ncbi:EPIDERMAL PATTERNING FACTOR-like protein 1 [Macadamia integrifolia]|uniref:EPIDERMAL PATTERNING FACTOR-like protein 1 n=1 Tax=Macadamia integrifolia TaxID=60698 RepID=UPI001C4FABB9|nr:EPIDERMAL PATTERNING FACTOR-like protein 1 [Macadamia integrifolia]
MVLRDGSMAKNLLSSVHNTITLVIFVTLLHLLLSPASCVSQQLPSLAPQGLLIEDKTRLGSTPPSCRNKCNECHPCIAVQVPTIPSHDRVQPGLRRAKPVDLLVSSPSKDDVKYSNYKPVGWKCRCGNLLFNP